MHSPFTIVYGCLWIRPVRVFVYDTSVTPTELWPNYSGARRFADDDDDDVIMISKSESPSNNAPDAFRVLSRGREPSNDAEQSP